MVDTPMPLTAHLTELRGRIFVCVIAIGIGFHNLGEGLAIGLARVVHRQPGDDVLHEPGGGCGDPRRR